MAHFVGAASTIRFGVTAFLQNILTVQIGMKMNTRTSEKPISIGERVSISQRGKRRIWSADFRHDGCHQRKSLKTSNLARARKAAMALEVALDSGSFNVLPKATPIDQAIERFIASKKLDGRSKKTLVKYESELRTFSKFANSHRYDKIHQISATLFDAYRSHRSHELNPHTIYTHAIIIKCFTKWCESRALIDADPLRKISVPKPHRAVKWSPALKDINDLLQPAHSDPQLEQMIAVLAFTGMRSGELVHLRPGDVDLQDNWLHIKSRAGWQTKTRQDRMIPIHSRLRPYLVAAKAKSASKTLLFCAQPSKQYPKGDHAVSQDKLLQRVQGLAPPIGVSVGHKKGGLTVHSLRHFFRTFATNKGAPTLAIDIWMGHVGQRTTGALYYQLSAHDSQELMSKIPFLSP